MSNSKLYSPASRYLELHREVQKMELQVKAKKAEMHEIEKHIIAGAIRWGSGKHTEESYFNFMVFPKKGFTAERVKEAYERVGYAFHGHEGGPGRICSQPAHIKVSRSRFLVVQFNYVNV